MYCPEWLNRVFWANVCVCVLQVSAWGGYVFIINLIPLHVFVLLLMQRYSRRLYIGESALHECAHACVCVFRLRHTTTYTHLTQPLISSVFFFFLYSSEKWLFCPAFFCMRGFSSPLHSHIHINMEHEGSRCLLSVFFFSSCLARRAKCSFDFLIARFTWPTPLPLLTN